MSRTTLAIELSTPHGQLAVIRGGEILFEQTFVSDRSHNSMLYGPLGDALNVCGIDLIVVGTGPGSYTGVRIGIAAAQGVALSRSLPVIGWSSLASLGDEPAYTVIGDARRGQAYTAVVQAGRVSQLSVLPVEQLRLSTGLHLTADSKPLAGNEQIQPRLPSARRLAQIASELSQQELAVLQSQPLEPWYVQEAFVTKPRATSTR